MALGAFKGSRKGFDRLPEAPVSIEQAPLYGMYTRYGPIVPNVHEWRPGDVIVSRRNRVGNKAITAYQQLLGLKETALWSHVAIYAGDGFLWDATPGHHIQGRSTGEFVRTVVEFGVFRLIGPKLDAETLNRHIREQSTQRYNVGTYLFELASRAIPFTGRRQDLKLPSASVICSVFVERVLFRTAGRQIFDDIPVPVPADFADPTRFNALDLRWCRPAA